MRTDLDSDSSFALPPQLTTLPAVGIPEVGIAPGAATISQQHSAQQQQQLLQWRQPFLSQSLSPLHALALPSKVTSRIIRGFFLAASSTSTSFTWPGIKPGKSNKDQSAHFGFKATLIAVLQQILLSVFVAFSAIALRLGLIPLVSSILSKLVIKFCPRTRVSHFTRICSKLGFTLELQKHSSSGHVSGYVGYATHGAFDDSAYEEKEDLLREHEEGLGEVIVFHPLRTLVP